MALLSKEEKHIQPKVEEAKMTFFKSEEKEVAGVAWLGNQRGVGKVAGPTS